METERRADRRSVTEIGSKLNEFSTPASLAARRQLGLERLGLLAIFSMGFFGYLMHTLDWFRALPGDLGDPRFNSYVLEHLFQWMTGLAPSLWSPAFFYPFESTLAFSDNHFGTGWIYALIRLIGFDREYAYAGWFAVAVILNFWSCYYALKKLNFSVLAAAAGAFTFAFGLAVLHKEAHAQLTYRFAIPLAFYAFYQFLLNGRLAYLAQAAAWGALQFYLSIYLGVFLAYLLLITAFVYWAVNAQRTKSQFRQFRTSGFTRSGILSWSVIFISAFLVAILLYKYQSVSIEYGFRRSLEEIMTMLPRPESYLVADRSVLTSWVGSWISGIPMRHEHQMFFGLGISLIALVGCVLAWRQENNGSLVRVAAITLLALVLMTTLFGSYSFYYLVLKVPGLSSVRAVSRIVLVMMLPLAILVAAAFEMLHQKWQGQSQPNILSGALLLIVAVLLLTLETVMYKPYNSSIAAWQERKAEVEKLLPANIPKDAILYLTQKKDEHFAFTEVDAMLVAQDRLLRTINGYSGNAPRGYTPPDPCISYKKRLNDYFSQYPKSAFERLSLESQILTVIKESCPHEPSVNTDWVITGDAAENIELNLKAVEGAEGLRLTLSIKNRSNVEFSTLHGKGPIRLSWRFVPLNKQGNRLSEPAWETRKELTLNLKPDSIYKESFAISRPLAQGSYLLEATLVQEGVRWFHDLGMIIPSIKIDVKG